MNLLSVENLSKSFSIRSGLFSREIGCVRAVENVSFEVKEGCTVGIVGESGCGKSTLGKTLMKILEPDQGKIIFHGKDISQIKKGEFKKSELRKQMQMIFQDPYSCLNPRMTISQILEEPLVIHHEYKNRGDLLKNALSDIGFHLSDLQKYPHEFSGGQRQRIGIARAMMLRPSLIIADEPVSALDVSIQSQILNLMMDLQKKYNLSYIFIAHNLAVVKHICHEVGVMYLGQMVEYASKEELFFHPFHPYTQALLQAVPSALYKGKRQHALLEGDIPSPLEKRKGCAFSSRCSQAMPLCFEQMPTFQEVRKGHQVACWLYQK